MSLLDDVPGLAVMRTVAMLANEAADAVNQGVCDAAAADMAMQKGVNYPRGPLAWADAVGLANVMAVLDHLARAYGEDRYRCSTLIRRKVCSGGVLSQRPSGRPPGQGLIQPHILQETSMSAMQRPSGTFEPIERASRDELQALAAATPEMDPQARL